MLRRDPLLSGGALALAALLAAPAAGQEWRQVAVPSGQDVRLMEVFLEPQEGADETWIRFRFLAPAIGPGPEPVPFAVASEDMAHLCDAFVVPLLAARGLAPDLVVISFSDRATSFGQTDPDAVQYFEAFVIVDGRCEWELF
jgi:hypothetical protein